MLHVGRQWREKQAAIIEDRDRKSDEKHQQILERAKRDLEKFYREYNEKKDHMRAKAAKEDRESNHGQVAVEGANVWVRGLSGKGDRSKPFTSNPFLGTSRCPCRHFFNCDGGCAICGVLRLGQASADAAGACAAEE